MASQHILATGKISKWGSSIRIAPHTDQAAADLGTILERGMDDEAWRKEVEHGLSILDTLEDAATADLIEAREDESFWRNGC